VGGEQIPFQYFFLLKNNFLATELRKGKSNVEVFSKQLFVRGKGRKKLKICVQTNLPSVFSLTSSRNKVPNTRGQFCPLPNVFSEFTPISSTVEGNLMREQNIKALDKKLCVLFCCSHATVSVSNNQDGVTVTLSINLENFGTKKYYFRGRFSRFLQPPNPTVRPRASSFAWHILLL
jgi:hypothetical protein